MKIRLAQFHHIVLQSGQTIEKKMESARGRQMSGILWWTTKSMRRLNLLIFAIAKQFAVLTFSGNPSYCRAPYPSNL